MGKRKLPFGYRMELGVEVIHPEEADVVRDIFNRYMAGESFKGLAESLSDQPIPYNKGMPWNKNVIARILDDSRYVGEKGFPAIIEEVTFQAVKERRKENQCPVRKTEVEKALRQLSGHPPTAKIASQVLLLLNGLVRDPAAIQEPEPPSQTDAATCRQELDQVLTQFPVDEDRANALVRRSATLYYNAICPGEYETVRLKRIFAAAQPMEQLDAEFLRSTATSIIVDRNNVIGIRLKNQQLIERRETA